MNRIFALGRLWLAPLMIALLTVGCGTTVEKQQNRYKRNMDKIEALLAKHPHMRPAVAAKLDGYTREYDQVMKTAADKKVELARLNRRIEEYVGNLDPTLNKRGAATAGGTGKLNQPAPVKGVAPGMAKPGMQPGMAKPGMQPGMGMKPGMQPGMAKPGMQPGMGTQPGLAKPGSTGMMGAKPGMQPGMAKPGMGTAPSGMGAKPGMGAQPGMAKPGMAKPGMGTAPSAMGTKPGTAAPTQPGTTATPTPMGSKQPIK